MAKDQGAPPPRNPKPPATKASAKVKVGPLVGAKAPAVQGGAGKGGTGKPAAPAAPRKPFNLPQFFREVRAEGRKITWTPWKETWITSVMVFIMVALTAVFFALLDGGLNIFIQQILKLAA